MPLDHAAALGRFNPSFLCGREAGPDFLIPKRCSMSLLGLTLDYGPYAFLDMFDYGFTPNGSDNASEYSTR